MLPVISIIVPVFNVERLLSKCLDSLLMQNFQNMEIILVDDGSTDASSIICDQYAATNNKIRVIHTVNQGPGSARNTGIEHASGIWICFVDADDWCEPNFISSFFQEDTHPYDLVIQGMVKDLFDSSSKVKHIFDARYDIKSIEKCVAENDLLQYGAPFCKLFKRSILKKYGILFPTDYQYGEDTVFFLRYLGKCRCVRCYSHALYHYVEHSVNSLSKKTHESIPLQHFIADSICELKNVLRHESSKKLEMEYNRKCMSMTKLSFCNMYRLNYTWKQKCRTICYFKQNVRKTLHFSGLGFSDKLFLIITSFPVYIQVVVYDILFTLGIIRD